MMDMSEQVDSFLDVVQAVFPEVVSEDEAKYILWNWTAFPFHGMSNEAVQIYRQQLSELREKSAGDMSLIPALVEAVVERGMREAQKRTTT